MNKHVYSELLSQGNYICINKKLIAVLGLEMAIFLSFLIDKYNYHANNTKDPLEQEAFFATNNDILIFTGLKASVISKLKKEGQNLKLFSIKTEGNPAKTFYTINFEKIHNIFLLEESVKELSYNRIFKEKIDIKNFSYATLNTLSKKELHLFCKSQKIKYFGYYSKEELIKSILKQAENKVIEKNYVDFFDNTSEKTVKELRKVCKELNISYTGKDNKQSLIQKISSKKEVDDLVTKKTGNKWTKKLITSDQKNWNKQEQITITKKQKQSHDHDVNDFEIIFKEFGINFTAKNKNSVQELLKSMTKEEVIDYLKDTYNNIKSNPSVLNLPALFSQKICKGETQNSFIQKELTPEKKEWLNRYSGIISDQTLKKDIEKIIIDIPLDILQKNKSKLSTMSTFEFKRYLYFLKSESKVS